MFTIKEVSNLLQVTPQNIYKQQATLIEKGYLYKNEQGKKMITQDGLNYLKDRQTEFLKFKPVEQPAKENEKIENANTEFEKICTNNELLNQLLNQFKQEIATLNNQLKVVEEEKNYFKAKFEEKDNLLNEYLNQHLLPPTEEERQEKEKRGFWYKLFNK